MDPVELCLALVATAARYASSRRADTICRPWACWSRKLAGRAANGLTAAKTFGGLVRSVGITRSLRRCHDFQLPDYRMPDCRTPDDRIPVLGALRSRKRSRAPGSPAMGKKGICRPIVRGE